MVHGRTEREFQLYRVSGLQRSEEHTSELQSPCNLVCRLLLEKKKKMLKTRLLLRDMNTRCYSTCCIRSARVLLLVFIDPHLSALIIEHYYSCRLTTRSRSH